MDSFTINRSRWAKVRALRGPEFWFALQAPVLLPMAAFVLRRYRLVDLQRALSRRARRSRQRWPDRAAAHAAAERVAWSVQVAAAYGPWPANCLQRSLVLWWMLKRYGLDGDLRIGVRRDPVTRALDFHAWVEHHGEVINDRRDVRERYAVFDRPIAPRHAPFT